MGRHGHAPSAEGQACELQDTAGAEDDRRITQECHGQEYVLSPTHPFSLLIRSDGVKSQQEKPRQGDIWGSSMNDPAAPPNSRKGYNIRFSYKPKSLRMSHHR